VTIAANPDACGLDRATLAAGWRRFCTAARKARVCARPAPRNPRLIAVAWRVLNRAAGRAALRQIRSHPPP